MPVVGTHALPLICHSKAIAEAVTITPFNVPKRIPLSADEVALKRRFGATVRKYRQRLAVSQEELAWRADMHRTYLADVERGVRNLSLSSIARLVGAIDVSLSSFFATLESLDLSAAKPGRVAKKQAPAKRAAKRRR